MTETAQKQKETVETVEITEIGHHGDGIADAGEARVFVPFTVPGDKVRIARDGIRGRVVEFLEQGPNRREPPCPHAEECGCCPLIHIEREAYLAFKRDLVVKALAQRGIEAAVEAPIEIPPASRRRATLAARRTKKTMLLGQTGRLSHAIVDTPECRVLDPAIAAALPDLRRLIASGLSRKGVATLGVTATANGIDLVAEGVKELDPPALRALAADAEAAGLARLTWNGETVMERAPAAIDVDGIALVPPAGAFLQASAAAQDAMIRLVREGVGEAKHIADLFAGCGTFTLPLARRAQVHAVEADAAMLDALKRAADTDPGLKPITREKRNLFTYPMTAPELAPFGALVFDPPRAGAKEQAIELAKSAVPAVVAVSCNPATFARDARALIDGGYRLERVVPVDQFVWSAHIELVATFKRA